MAWSTLYSIKNIYTKRKEAWLSYLIFNKKNIHTKRKEPWLSYRGNVISEGQLVINHDHRVSCNLSGSTTRVPIVMQMLWCMAWLGGPARFNWRWLEGVFFHPSRYSEERLRLRREVVRMKQQVVQHLLRRSDNEQPCEWRTGSSKVVCMAKRRALSLFECRGKCAH